MDKTNELSLKKKHIMQIKNRLNAAKTDYEKLHNIQTLSFRKLHELLKNTYGEFDTPSIPTLTSIFDLTKDTKTDVTLTYVVQLAKFFNKSLSYILALPDDSDTSLDPLEKIEYGDDASSVTDPHYHGDFVCYMLRSTYAPEDIKDKRKVDTLRDNDTIIKADLSISYENDLSTAKMTIHNTRKEFNNEVQYFDSTLKGNAILINSSQNIILSLVSANNRPYTIMFDYEPFDNGLVYYREAAVLTNSGGRKKLPHFFKMIILRKEVDSKDYEYIRGLLSLNVDNVVISKKKFDELCESNEIVKNFSLEYSDYLSLQEKTFYTIPESLFELNFDSPLSFESFKKALLILRNNSYSLAQIEIGKDNKANTIAKTLQQYTLSEPDEC